ncbi:GGDEF domain-containing protein [Colwellia sp. MB02u-6]|uniref:tetratricopeptide repeat-containing diguanylate cyclase n=1 Tax=Colwellia sp. MB02u-6 TaxID=2759824 RepID=UPI0015F408F5|nr:tetratricopeptide repeat-containing diguanylate cyclase [Colwellia sp. MB02u-6]MBA6328484.1 GGDEF domain-containing protein [Colwellia sp. MB02u-6]
MRRLVKLTIQNSGLIFFVLLSISCKLNALQPLTESDFNTLLLHAEQLNNSDPKAALVLLNRHKTELNTQPITNQVNYYRIQSAAYTDQALYSLSEASSEQGLKLAKQMNNPSIFIADLAYTKGFAIENLGDLGGAFLLYQNGLDVARSMNNQKLIARGLINTGAILYLQQDYKQSLITLNQALALANAIGDDALLGEINNELGLLYGHLGEKNQAHDYFQQAYQYYKTADKHNYALKSLHNVANNHTNQKNFEQAIKVYRVLESEIEPNSSHQFIANVYRELAWALLNKKDAETESAYQYILLAGEYIEDVEQHLVKLQYLINKAYILEKMARYQEALVSLERAKILLERKTSNIYDTSELKILFLSAKLHYALGHYNQAYEIQTQYFTRSITGEQARETTEVDELMLQYESETAQRHNNILEKKQRIQHLQLQKMTLDVNSRKAYVGILALCTLLLAWCLYYVIKEQRNLINATRTDSLTGVVNRGRLLELGEEYFITAQNQQQAFSVYMIDIDLFKKINDQFGHVIGDKALKEIAIQGQNLMRSSDVFGRFDGEEFIALLPNTGNDEALEVAQRLQENIEQAKWQTQQIKQLTVSIGVATFEQGNYANFSALLKVADEELLKVKQSGSNTVSYYE